MNERFLAPWVATLLAIVNAPALGVDAARASTSFTEMARDSQALTMIEPSEWGSGVSIVDFDGDGDHDVFLADGPGRPGHLFRNDGGIAFVDVTSDVGILHAGDVRAGVFADYDDDGDLDLFLAGWQEPDVLYRNDAGQFVDVTVSAGLGHPGPANGAAWADVDADGMLDLYVAQYSHTVSNVLYRNLGNGSFVDVTAIAGVSDLNWSFQPVFTDFDRDGDVDLFVSNDKADLNRLFRNDGGTFVDVAPSAQVAGPIWGMGVAVGDFDLTGTMDLYVTNEPVGNALYVNAGYGVFAEAAAAYHVEVFRNGWGTEFFDYDCDGDEDLYVVNAALVAGPQGRNALFRNEGPGLPFTDVTIPVGVGDEEPGFGFACGDVTGDGYPDMVVSNSYGFNLLYVSSGGSHHWLEVELHGTTSNRSGVGAWVEIRHGGQTQHREVRCGSSYLSQGPLLAHFGLGTATLVDQVLVRWPSGIVDAVYDVAVDQRLEVVEGTTVGVPTGATPSFALGPPSPNPFNPRVRARLVIDGAQRVEVGVYDARGRRVRTLANRRFAPGVHLLRWDGRDDRGAPCGSGSYHLRAEGEGRLDVRALTLVR